MVLKGGGGVWSGWRGIEKEEEEEEKEEEGRHWGKFHRALCKPSPKKQQECGSGSAPGRLLYRCSTCTSSRSSSCICRTSPRRASIYAAHLGTLWHCSPVL
ncbi:hypothetical protein E2C01_024257 [Portunus trituberculatus]|uniref:Uncharacterized protein n=1 Tax=Portunus trituberculatus TaxID=210409 RepID=A0A5B7ECP2_PORTR|nr:hypothetical protein [Portunus trituberculatus]